ncbi:formylglycine-generating enzyme family protein [Corticibacter populi]|nr:SUMF1/EgtB/PvdO family nonheme iron enzyme [Corticibacter populi]
MRPPPSLSTPILPRETTPGASHLPHRSRGPCPASAARARALAGMLVSAAACATALTACRGDSSADPATEPSANLVMVPAGTVRFLAVGEFTRAGFPAAPPWQQARIEQPLRVMRQLVSQADYARCVAAQHCKPADGQDRRGASASAQLPVTGVSWVDAQAYAQWLAAETGLPYRLPRYEEWVLLAGDAFEEAAPLDEYRPDNPAQYWLQQYAREMARASVEPAPQPLGHFGRNAYGIEDLGGNVWEWTDTCYTRTALADGAAPLALSENCGIRAVAGQHPSFIPDFIRDARSGACSVGAPPSNLGIRLVVAAPPGR